MFPAIWKKARLVLLEKPKKDPSDVISYRPICILNVIANLLEKLILMRLSEETVARGDLAPNQFGFHKGRSTVDAINVLKQIVEKIFKTSYRHRVYYAVITLDIKNALNSAPWGSIIATLKQLQYSTYLINILQSYREHTQLMISGENIIWMTAGVP